LVQRYFWYFWGQGAYPQADDLSPGAGRFKTALSWKKEDFGKMGSTAEVKRFSLLSTRIKRGCAKRKRKTQDASFQIW
jgi:hypothetical protein